MQVRYYVYHNGNHAGPLTFAEIESQLNNKDLFPTDYVYVTVGEKSDWLPILEFILVHGPKEKVLQPTLKTLGAESPDDDHVDWKRFKSGIPAALGTSRNEPQSVSAYPIIPAAAARTPPVFTPPPPPQPKKVVKAQPPPPLPKQAPPKPFVRPTPKAPAPLPPRIDASAVARVDVMPAQATRLTIQITGNARVGEELEIFVVAQTEDGNLDHTFNEVVQIACDRPLAGLGALRFTNGTARLRVRCLTQGTHEFSLILGQNGAREFTCQSESTEMADQRGLIH